MSRCHVFRSLREIAPTAAFGVLLVGALLFGIQSVQAQDFEVTGTVVDAEEQTPLPGVNVREAGTNRGTTTDTEGQFTFMASGPQATLVFSFVGFQKKRVPLDGRSSVRVVLTEKVQALDEVVVTAFGIERERRGLGYSVEEVQGADIAESGTNNLGDALQGRVSGVTIESPPTGPGGSSRITIRGNTNFGNNSPLFVVDGVPIRNVQEGNASRWGGTDGGNALSKLNPEDIESISVLKGGAAAALYGTRALNGVVLIETKGGDISQGEYFSAEYSGSVRGEVLKPTFEEFQYKYGQGTNGEPPQNQTQALNQAFDSWGARISEVDEAVQFDGEVRPYRAQDDNLDKFYDTGVRTEHSVALSRGGDSYDVRMSLSQMNDDHIIPTTELDRTSMNLRGSGEIGNLYMDGKLNYIIERAEFRPELSDNPANPMLSLSFMPTTLNVNTLDPHKTEDGKHRAWSNSPFRPNPFWGMREFERDDQQRRVQGFALARYNFTPDISLQARLGTDWYTLHDTFSEPGGTPWINEGRITETTTRRREDNFNLLFRTNQDLPANFGLDATLGGNLRYEQNEQVSANGSEFVIPGLIDFNNTAETKQGGGYNFSEKQVNSVFGKVEFDYQDYLYLEVTGRNDWSSTLPEGNNSFFYPSVSSSFIFTDVFESLPDVLSSGTLRASFARVGGDTGPYQLDLLYGLAGSHPSRTGGSVSRGIILSNQIPPFDLKPRQKETIEFGTNLQFLDGRLGFDLTLYQESSFNQIIGVPVSNTSGFSTRLINAGDIRNRGIEIQLNGTILQASDYSWSLRGNFSAHNNKVRELEEGVETEILGRSRSRHTSIEARVGEPYGQIVGPTFKRTENGEIIHEDGLPVVGESKAIGNQEENWSAGLTNVMRWQGLTLEALFDVSWGGDIYSFTNAQAYQTGKHEDTLPGREQGFVVGDGVKENSNGEFVENDVQVDPEDYYGHIGANIAEPFVYDASYVRLRQLRLSYVLPEVAINALPGVSSAQFSLVGRNLWLIYDDVPNVDPSASYSTQADHGLEHASLPVTRTFGLDLRLRF